MLFPDSRKTNFPQIIMDSINLNSTFFIYVMEAIKPGMMSLSYFQRIITFRKHNYWNTPGTEKVPQVQYQVSIIDCVRMWVWK